jgi:protein-S-isoprenylcysteine O-methyltransferase Ste14
MVWWGRIRPSDDPSNVRESSGRRCSGRAILIDDDEAVRMSRSVRRSAVGTVVFFAIAPGSTAGLVPWLLTGWHHPVGGASRWIGVALIIAGFGFTVAAFVQFAAEGRGTPAPVAPTEVLVVGGLYRWIRNPMYVAVAAMIGGQAVLFAANSVTIWLAIFMLSVWSFVNVHEQPALQRRYGDAYLRYKRAVPAWHPRLRPWRG